MDIIICDYTNIRYFSQLHTILRDAMGWACYYGCNLSALHDITIAEGFPDQIIFRGTSYLHPEWKSYWEQMLSVLSEDMEKYNQECGVAVSYLIES